MSAKKIAAANWKMFKNPTEARSFAKELLRTLPAERNADVIIFPSALLAEAVQEGLKGTSVSWGGQNCHFEKQGAFTGESSAWTLSAMGAKHVLVGHSERRTLFGETDEFLAKKVKAAQDAGLSPMLCVGETLAERDAGKTFEVIGRQLRAGLMGADLSKAFTVAYEPVWAIGTGRNATPEQAEEAHGFLRNALKELGAPGTTSILYGGSVKPDNASKLAEKPNIDGFLVGGASLEPQSFVAIVSAL